MLKETMTPRERWLAVLQRKKPDRIPMDYWATDEVTEKLKKHLRVNTDDEMFEKLHIDRPFSVYPEYAGPKLSDGYDVWGQTYKKTNYGTGEYVESFNTPLASYKSVSEIEKNYKWPSADWYDFSKIPALIKGKEHRPINGGGSEPFLLYKKLRGDIQAFMDMLENPEIVHYCLGKMFDYSYEMTRRTYEAIPGKITFSYIAEDMGAQEDLMFSPEQIRGFLLPGMKRMIDLVHSCGAYVFHHNDGAIRKIIPDMIKTGIDVLNPVQWRCKGMDREGLKRDFGKNLIFHGGVDNQQTLPFGTPEDVRQEVFDNIRILGKDGGYIIAPCHNIQPVTMMKNIVAMYQAGYEYGWSK